MIRHILSPTMERCGLFTILGIFLHLCRTLACNVDEDCDVYERCCERTDGRGYLGYGVCVDRQTCYGFCVDKEDCLPPEICDTFAKRCTTECFWNADCHPSNYCKDNHCVLEEDDSIGTTPLVVFAFVSAMCAVCCCCACLRYRSRRGQLMRYYGADRNSAIQTAGGRNEEQPVNEQTVEMTSPTDQANGQTTDVSADVLAANGPPSYLEVGDIPELPPPSYEEAMRLSTQDLSQGTERHRV